MLVLTRKKDESIIIGDNIEIVVVDIGTNYIKLGIKAPKDVEIHRKEIYVSIKEETEKAAQSSIDINMLKDIFK